MSAREIFWAALVFASIVSAALAQDIPDLREESPKGEVNNQTRWDVNPYSAPAPTPAPQRHATLHKIVAPPQPTPTPTPAPWYRPAPVATPAPEWHGGIWNGSRLDRQGSLDNGLAVNRKGTTFLGQVIRPEFVVGFDHKGVDQAGIGGRVDVDGLPIRPGLDVTYDVHAPPPGQKRVALLFSLETVELW